MNHIYFFKVKERVNGIHNVVKHYFQLNGHNYEINENNLKMLKDNLKYPFFIETYALSRAEIGRIIRYFKEDDIKVDIQETYKKNDEYLRFEISFSPILDIKKTDERKR